jgi:anti-sigma factor (TIGR02949 family)
METNHDCGCASAFGRIEALVDGQLSPSESAEVRRHCASCESCSAELDIVETLTLRFRAALAEPPPPGFRETIFSNLKMTANFRAPE